jgi:hypothetical protein
MANIKISELPAATNVNATDVLPVDQGNVTRKVRVDQLPVPSTDWPDITNKPSTFPPDLSGVTPASIGAQPAGNYATLVNGEVPASQLPSYVDDIIEVANFNALPAVGESGKIYVTADNNKVYRWGGSSYVEIVASPQSTDAVPEGVVNLYFTSQRAADAAPVQSVAGRDGDVVLTKTDVGLSNVDNTSDLNKPISTATQTALNGKAELVHAPQHNPLGGSDPIYNENLFFRVKNQTGALIPKGRVVRADGAVGATGVIKIAQFFPDTSARSSSVMGLTYTDIADGDEGLVLGFGELRNVNTSAFNDGDVLYAGGASAGGLTNIEPNSTFPQKVIVAACLRANQNNGVLLVRPNHLEPLDINAATNSELNQKEWNISAYTEAPIEFTNNVYILPDDQTIDATWYKFNPTQSNLVVEFPYSLQQYGSTVILANVSTTQGPSVTLTIRQRNASNQIVAFPSPYNQLDKGQLYKFTRGLDAWIVSPLPSHVHSIFEVTGLDSELNARPRGIVTNPESGQTWQYISSGSWANRYVTAADSFAATILRDKNDFLLARWRPLNANSTPHFIITEPIAPIVFQIGDTQFGTQIGQAFTFRITNLSCAPFSISTVTETPFVFEPLQSGNVSVAVAGFGGAPLVNVTFDAPYPLPSSVNPALVNPSFKPLLSNCGTVGSQVGIATRNMALAPIRIERRTTINQVSVKIGGAGIIVATEFGFGIYDTANFTNPRNLLFQTTQTMPVLAANAHHDIAFPSYTLDRGLYWVAFATYGADTINLGSAEPDNNLFAEVSGSNPAITGSALRGWNTFILVGSGSSMPAILTDKTIEMRVTTASSTTLRGRIAVPAFYFHSV